jgi:hypothetical protein
MESACRLGSGGDVCWWLIFGSVVFLNAVERRGKGSRLVSVSVLVGSAVVVVVVIIVVVVVVVAESENYVGVVTRGGGGTRD